MNLMQRSNSVRKAIKRTRTYRPTDTESFLDNSFTKDNNDLASVIGESDFEIPIQKRCASLFEVQDYKDEDSTAQKQLDSVLFQNGTKLSAMPTHHDVQHFPTHEDATHVRKSLGFLV